MDCKKFCTSDTNRLTENVELCSLSLEIFLRAHRLLKNFLNFLKSHACTCDDINYDQIPLHGALDVMSAAVTSLICGKTSNEEYQRHGLFHDTSVCVRYRSVQDLPEDIVQKVDMILKCLEKSCAIENIICQVKDVLQMLENTSARLMPESVRNLSLCMKEIMKRLVCCGQPVSGPIYNNQMKLLLNLVNKFIRGWSEKRSDTSPFLKVCKYCNSVISETTRQWGTFCCKNAQQYHDIWKEWSLQQSISDAARTQTEKAKGKWLGSKQFMGDSEDTEAMYAAEHRRPRTSSQIEEFQDGLAMKYRDKDEDAIARRIDGTSSRKELGRYTSDDVDLTKALHEKMGRAKRRGDIDRPDEYPIGSDGRRKRDDVRYRSKLGKIHAPSRGLQDGTVERAAIGKMRKIRKGRDTIDEIGGEKRARKIDRDREESGHVRRRRKKARKEDALVDDTSETTEDKIGAVKGRRRKRRGRASDDTELTESELTYRRKVGGTSTEEKSTLGSDKRSKKGTSVLSKKGRKGLSSIEMDDDRSKRSGSRMLKRKPGVTKHGDVDASYRRTIEYQLSNQHFVKRGWTILPVAKTMKKVVHYRTMPAKPHLDWFKRRTYDEQIRYDDGPGVFLNFRKDGTGEVFYPNGKVAVQVSRPDNRKYDMYTVFSPGGKDMLGIERKSQVIALFDSMGNGAIFNEDGATRLSYNQIGGIWRDNPAGVPYTWMWDTDQKKSITKTVYMEKPATHLENHLQKGSGNTKGSTSPASSRNKEKKVVQQKPVVVVHQEEEEEEKEVVESGGDYDDRYSKDTSHFKTICIKLNDFMGCRILNRRNIGLQFAAGKKSIRIELGTILDLSKEVSSYFVDTSSKAAILRGRFQKLTSSKLQPDDSLYRVARQLDCVKGWARQRKFMINKYKPFWYAWKQEGTRCNPR